MLSRALLIALTTGASGLVPVIARAQTVAVGADAAVRSSYIWRGLTRRNAVVFQGDLYLSLRESRFTLTMGGWASAEWDTSEENQADIGLEKSFFGERNLWAELSRDFGFLDLAFGYTRYLYADQGSNVRLNAFDTSDLYTRADLRWRRLTFRVAGWYDVDRVKGVYAETGVYFTPGAVWAGEAAVTAMLGALLGWSWGLSAESAAPLEPAYFADDGLTHLDFPAIVFIGIEHFYVTVELHVVRNIDDLTRRVHAGQEGDKPWKAWAGVTLSVRQDLVIQ